MRNLKYRKPIAPPSITMYGIVKKLKDSGLEAVKVSDSVVSFTTKLNKISICVPCGYMILDGIRIGASQITESLIDKIIENANS